MSDAEEEIESNQLFHDHFKIGEESETPTVFILPGDNEVGLNVNGRLEDIGDTLEHRPLFDERLSDNEDGDRSNEREVFRSSLREPSCSCFSCKSDRSRHEKRRSTECNSHCNHHDHHDRHDHHDHRDHYDRSSFHGECTSERCHSHKEAPCHSDSCFASHCNKGSEHGGCHYGYRSSSRGCHDQMCSSMHCHGSRCHGDSCYQKHHWRDYMLDEEEHRIRGKKSTMYRQFYENRFPGERGGHRNPFDSYPPPFVDNMFMPPDPLLMNYNQRRTPRSTSAADKQHHAERTGAFTRKHSESDLAPIDTTSLTKNATNFKGGQRAFESGAPNTRQRGRKDILTAPGSAIRRMKELVSKYSDRHGKEGDSTTMLNRQEHMDIDEGELHGAQGDQGMVKAEAYVCHICGKEFAWAITLKRHMLIHTGIRQYQCNICNKAFTRSHHLKRHMTVHTGEKPYVCHICNKAYSRSDRLSSHMNNHEGYVANKKRGRVPAKVADEKPAHVQLTAGKIPDGPSVEAGDKNNANRGEEVRHLQDREPRVASGESAPAEKQWMEPNNPVEGGTTDKSWTPAEDTAPGFRIVTSEQIPWFSSPLEERNEEQAGKEVMEQGHHENDASERGRDAKYEAKLSPSNQGSSKPLDLLKHEDEGQVGKASISSASESEKRSSPFQGFGLTRTEKDTLSKFKIHSPEIRPQEFRPPEYFAPPGFGLQGHSGPGFIPGNMLDAKQSNLPPLSMHSALFRHDSKSGSRVSPLGRDPRGSSASFLPNDPSKFAYSSLLNARSEFINKQRMAHPSLFYHELPHDMARPDDAVLHQKPDDPDVKYGPELLGSYHSSRKEEGHIDDSTTTSEQEGTAVSGEESMTGMQSKFKVQLTQHRDMKMPMDVKPPLDPHLNLFTFRHMVHQPSRSRQSTENSGQKRVLPRTFVCRTCNKAFTRSHHLRRHELIHSGQKPFKCTICGRAFNRSDHLNLHLATHYQSANGPRSYSKDASKGKRKDADSGVPHFEGGARFDGVAEKEPLRYADDGRAEGSDPNREEYPVTVLQGNSMMVKTESGMVVEGFEVDNPSADTANVSTVDIIRTEPSQKFDIVSSI